MKMSDMKQRNGGDVITIMLAAAAAVIAAWALIGYIAKIVL